MLQEQQEDWDSQYRGMGRGVFVKVSGCTGHVTESLEGWAWTVAVTLGEMQNHEWVVS